MVAAARVIFVNFVVQFTYMQVVDLPWLIDHQLRPAGMLRRSSAIKPSKERRKSRRRPWRHRAVRVAIVILICFALIALYYTGVSFATNDGSSTSNGSR